MKQKIYRKYINVYVDKFSPRSKGFCIIEGNDVTFDEVFDAKINSISNIELNHLYINRVKAKYNAKMKVGDVLEITFQECWRNQSPLEYIKSWPITIRPNT